MWKKICVILSEKFNITEKAHKQMNALSSQAKACDITFWLCEIESDILDEQLLAKLEEFHSQIVLVTDTVSYYEWARQKDIPVIPVETATDIEHGKKEFWSSKYILMGMDGISLSYIERIYQRIHHIPWTILRTKRTLVREITVEDVDALYEIYSEPSITRYTDPLYENPEQEKSFTRDYIEKVYEFFEYGIWIVEDITLPGKVIGRAGITVRDGYEDPELGYVFKKEYQNQGYATEVLSSVLEYAREELEIPRLRALMNAENIPSKKLIHKLGFSYDSTVVMGDQVFEQYAKQLL